MPNSLAGPRGPTNPLVPENRIQGVAAGNFDAGVNNVDPGTIIEQGILLPYLIDKRASWLDYRCTISIELDPGVVLHKILPQSAQNIDTLASGTFDAAGGQTVVTGVKPAVVSQGGIAEAIVPVTVTQFVRESPFDENTQQANTVSVGKFADIVQRMATSRYRFCLKGWAVRAAYKIPIPGLKTVCGVPAIPDWPQKVLSDSEVLGNFSGVPVYFSQWELWYFINVPPTAAQLPPPNVAEHIRADAQLPAGIQLPYSQPDSNAVNSGAPPLQRVITG